MATDYVPAELPTPEDLSPVAIERAIREVSNRIANSVKTCAERYEAFLLKDRDYDRAYAIAYLKHEGPQTEKRYAAEQATYAERTARDIADAAYRYADRLAKALENELRAYQSIGASVRATYSVAGRGDF